MRAPAGPARTRRQLAVAYLHDVEALDRAITVASRELSEAVTESATTVTTLFGVGPVVAAKILGQVGDVRRFSTKAHFASTAASRRSRPPAAASSATGSPAPATGS